MSKKRQTAIYDPQGDSQGQLTTLSYNYVDGHVIPGHFHREDQLVFAAKGVMTVVTSQGSWVVPPLRAVWIPGNEIHSITMSGQVLMRTLYFAPKFVRPGLKRCFVLNVSGLLRELILHSCSRKSWSIKVSRDRRLIEMIFDELKGAESVPLELPYPKDQRAWRVSEILTKNPSDSRTLDELCRDVGGSKRTIERVFLDETNMTFGKWRQQLRFLHGIRMLAAGEKVITAALDAGYSGPSAFISAFKKSFGQTPYRYFG
jgi:AraC-like DNA-binding protein